MSGIAATATTGCLVATDPRGELEAMRADPDQSIVVGRIEWAHEWRREWLRFLDRMDALRQKDPPFLRSSTQWRQPWHKEGKQRWGQQGFAGSLSLFVLRIEDRRRAWFRPDANGYFVAYLPAGNYLISFISYKTPPTADESYERDTEIEYHFAPKVAFKVPRSGRNFYIGVVKADVYLPISESRFTKLHLPKIEGRFSVSDAYHKDMAHLRKKFGSDLGDLDKALMKRNSQLPDLRNWSGKIRDQERRLEILAIMNVMFDNPV